METKRTNLIGYYLKWYYPDEIALGSKEIFYAPCNLWFSSIETIESDGRIITRGGLYREDSLRKYENRIGAKVYIPFVNNNISRVIPKYRSDRSIKEFFANIQNLVLVNFHPKRDTIHSIQDIIDYHRLIIRSIPVHRTKFTIIDSRVVNLEQEGHYVYAL